MKRARKAVPAIPENLLVHDLRRSAARNMIQFFEISEAEAMEMVGHKTRSMLQRYNIRSPKTVQQSGAKMDAKLREMREKALQAATMAAMATTTD